MMRFWLDGQRLLIHLITGIKRRWRSLLGILLGAIAALLLTTVWQPVTAQAALPSPQVHPLPPFIERLPELDADYFAEIQTTPLGYLVWNEFPVKVYVQQPEDDLIPARDQDDFEKWLKAVDVAIADWKEYVPLVKVTERETADIVLLRQRPPRDIQVDRENQRLIIPDARHGTARYEFYLTATQPPIVKHRFTVTLSPAQNSKHLRGTARHELGHALGIWGHSPNEDDVMYQQQVSRPPPISGRDLSVLRRVYEQPTRLGWPVLSDS
ncbi:MAG: peptidase [Spirulinaceae cyanobacterium]